MAVGVVFNVEFVLGGSLSLFGRGAGWETAESVVRDPG